VRDDTEGGKFIRQRGGGHRDNTSRHGKRKGIQAIVREGGGRQVGGKAFTAKIG